MSVESRCSCVNNNLRLTTPKAVIEQRIAYINVRSTTSSSSSSSSSGSNGSCNLYAVLAVVVFMFYFLFKFKLSASWLVGFDFFRNYISLLVLFSH